MSKLERLEDDSEKSETDDMLQVSELARYKLILHMI